MKRMLPFLLAAVLVTPALADDSMREKPVSPSAPGFEQLKALVGTWEATEEANKGVKLDYDLTAGGSAVVERMTMPDGSSMLTVYYSDGENLMLTHYCSLGSQPRMRGVVDGKAIKFAFLDATNVPTSDAQHMHDMTLSFVGKDRITEEWILMDGGKAQPMMIEFARAR